MFANSPLANDLLRKSNSLFLRNVRFANYGMIFLKNLTNTYMPIKKRKVIYELDGFPVHQNEGGLYAIMPYERLNKNNKAIFKLGMSVNMANRFETYHTDYPLGFYMKNLLIEPTKQNNYEIEKNYLKHVESDIMKHVTEHGGKILKTTTRIKNYDKKLQMGETEWVYANEKILDNAFNYANRKYGGRKLNASLDHINNEADKNKVNATYTGEIHYRIY